MSDICLEYFENGINAISASARNLSLLTKLLGHRSNILRALASYRNGLLPVLYQVRSVLNEPPHLTEKEAESASKIDPKEMLREARAAIKAMETFNADLAKVSRGNLLTYSYHKYALSPIVSEIVDGLEDVAAALESTLGEDGDIVSGDELLRRLG